MHMELRGAEKLSFREKQVATLKEMGYTSEKIAKTLSIAASSIATIYNRARAKGYQVVIIIPGAPLSVPLEEEEVAFDE